MNLKAVGDNFQLQEDVTIEGFTIPAGFITDFATIPRFALSIMGRPTRQEFRRASVLHDYLLVYNKVDNRTASILFHRVLLEDGTKPVKAYVMYLAVRYLRKVSKKFRK
jgi:hypothetical protein